MPRLALSSDEREAEIRRKLGVTAQRIRSKIAMMQPNVRNRHQVEIDAYLVELSNWEVGTASWPLIPDAVLSATKRWGLRT